MTYKETMTSDFFEAWFKTFLLPTLDRPSVIIMDNARFHRMCKLKELYKEQGHRLLPLPSAKNLRGSKSFSYRILLRLFHKSAAITSCVWECDLASVLTLTLATPNLIVALICSSGIPEPPCNTIGKPGTASVNLRKWSRSRPSQFAGYGRGCYRYLRQEVNSSCNHCYCIFDWSQFTATNDTVFFTTDSTYFSFN